MTLIRTVGAGFAAALVPLPLTTGAAAQDHLVSGEE